MEYRDLNEAGEWQRVVSAACREAGYTNEADFTSPEVIPLKEAAGRLKLITGRLALLASENADLQERLDRLYEVVEKDECSSTYCAQQRGGMVHQEWLREHGIREAGPSAT